MEQGLLILLMAGFAAGCLLSIWLAYKWGSEAIKLRQENEKLKEDKKILGILARAPAAQKTAEILQSIFKYDSLGQLRDVYRNPRLEDLPLQTEIEQNDHDVLSAFKRGEYLYRLLVFEKNVHPRKNLLEVEFYLHGSHAEDIGVSIRFHNSEGLNVGIVDTEEAIAYFERFIESYFKKYKQTA